MAQLIRRICMIIIISSGAMGTGGNQCIECPRYPSNTSERITQAVVLHKLMAEHNIHIRPDAEVKPLQLRVNMFIESFHSVSETKMEYSITTYFRQFWRDKRLVHNLTDVITVDGDITDVFWIPDTFFLNSKDDKMHSSPKQNSLFHIHPDGSIIYSLRMTLTLTCHMDLTNYPFDTQKCKIKIMSYAYKMKDIDLIWYGNLNDSVELEPSLKLPQYEISDPICKQGFSEYIPGNYSYLEVIFVLERRLGFYILQAFAPSVALVFISWLTLWIDPTSSPARATLAITTLLTLTTQATWIRSGIPKVGYVTAMDIWLVVCISMVFVILLEFTIVYYLQKNGLSSEDQRKIKRKLCSQMIAHTVSRDGVDDDTPTTGLASHSIELSCHGNTSSRNQIIDNTSHTNVKTNCKKQYSYHDIGKRIDKYCRIVFMIASSFFFVSYWIFYVRSITK
ncbi:glycine receptor subunit alpha-2-like [Glandiceps talaboti]